MSKFKKIEGQIGESIAEEFLRKKGYKIIEKNFRTKNGEVDIVAVEEGSNKVLVFVEVKTRESSEFGEPIEAINYWKLKSLVRVAQYYKMLHPNLPDQLRIDAVCIKISKDKRPIEIEHVENISS